MKKLFILAALVLAAASSKAQNTTIDTTAALTIRQLVKTNTELVGINNALRQHSKMAAWSAPIMMAGTAVLVAHPTAKVEGYNDNWHTFGLATVTAGALLFMASYTPLLRHRISLDQRGIVIDLP